MSHWKERDPLGLTDGPHRPHPSCRPNSAQLLSFLINAQGLYSGVVHRCTAAALQHAGLGAQRTERRATSPQGGSPGTPPEADDWDGGVVSINQGFPVVL
jgi:hypothetical protein